MIKLNDIIANFDLFIFDLDDTIVMTEKFHNIAWNITLTHFMNKEIKMNFYDYCGIFHSNKSSSYVNDYLENELKLQNSKNIIDYKFEKYFDMIKNNNVELNDGIKDFIELIIKNNKKFVIVTNTTNEIINFFCEKYIFLKKSDRIYTKEMFSKKKPDPECYIKICNDYPNLKKVGFEDSLTGIHAMHFVSEIVPFFVNTKNYYHFNYIINNYKNINYIVNFKF